MTKIILDLEPTIQIINDEDYKLFIDALELQNRNNKSPLLDMFKALLAKNDNV